MGLFVLSWLTIFFTVGANITIPELVHIRAATIR